MATILDQYLQKQAEIKSQVAENSLPMDSLLMMQEVNYRICVLETLRTFCQTAPVTVDTRVMGYHYQMVNAYVRFLLSERKFGPKTDAEGQKKRETAMTSLEQVVNDSGRQFASFKAATQDQYKKCVCDMVNTVLPVWIQYRNTYINI